MIIVTCDTVTVIMVMFYDYGKVMHIFAADIGRLQLYLQSNLVYLIPYRSSHGHIVALMNTYTQSMKFYLHQM